MRVPSSASSPSWRSSSAASPRRLLAALLIAAAVPAGAQEFPSDPAAFTERVAALLRPQLGDTPLTSPAALKLRFGDVDADLAIVHGQCRANPQNCGEDVSRFVDTAHEAHLDRNTPPRPEQLRLVVRTAEQAARESQAQPSDLVLQPRPLLADLVLVPVIETPRTLRVATPRDNRRLGLDGDAVHRRALANLAAALPPILDDAPPVKPGQLGRLATGPYDAARLALPASWAPLAAAQGGRLVVAPAALHSVFYVADESPTALELLRQQLRQARLGPRLSEVLLRWTAEGWQILPP